VSRSNTAIRTRKTAVSFHNTRAVVASIGKGSALRLSGRWVWLVGLVRYSR
jgi:hypothetical protein